MEGIKPTERHRAILLPKLANRFQSFDRTALPGASFSRAGFAANPVLNQTWTQPAGEAGSFNGSFDFVTGPLQLQ